MTVLILADELDISADAMVRELTNRDVPVFRTDMSRFPQSLAVDATFRSGRWEGWVNGPSRSLDLAGVRSVWYRAPTTFQFPAGLSPSERQHAYNEAKLGFGGVLLSLPARWVNHPGREADAAYKPVQLATAARCGLTVTNTLVTNMPEAVRRFAAAHGDVVTKMFGAVAILEQGGRSVAHTDRLTPALLDDLRGIEVTAHQFQRWVPKAHESRVVVVGSHQFAVAIRAGSEAAYVDWRTDYDNLTYERVDPPELVTAGIRALMRELGLAFGALDFVITPDGEWVFLEVNSGGQYGWLEDHTGIPVTATLADLLAEEEP